MQSLQEHLLVPVNKPEEQHEQVVVHAPNEPLQMTPFAFSYLHLALYAVLGVASGGTLFILSVWYPHVFTFLARTQLPLSRAEDADYVLVLVYGKGLHAQWLECPVHRSTEKTTNDSAKTPWIWFEFKKHRYVYSLELGEFRRYLATIREDLGAMNARINTGLSTLEVGSRIERFGANKVLIEKPRIPVLLFRKVVAPFYIFQVISAIIWFIEQYTVYAIIILCLSALSITNEIYVEVSNSNRLRSLVRSDHRIPVVRAGATAELHESELVPGDIVEVNEGPVCADILLLSGLCVADEASLTGEALPVNKEPAVRSGQVTEAIARTQFKASCLYAGSIVARVREGSGKCRGVVLSTGFSTGRGELFRSILFPKPISFEFERDSYRYLIVLWSIAIAAFIKRVVDGAGTNTPFFDTMLHSLDLITIAVPPALPLVLSSGIGFAMQRLQKRGIFCIDSRRVNSCGQVTCYCFDKTGTLTQEHLSFVGVDDPEAAGVPTLSLTPQVKLVMATCHSLSTHEGELQGYPLELAMFNASHYSMEYLNETGKASFLATVTSTEDKSQKYGVLKRFAFDAAHQRSSTIIEEVGTKKRFVVVKGSPEAVSAISVATPAGLQQKVHSYSADGYYCIGFGMKELASSSSTAIDTINREEVECLVEFQGVAIFKNELKPETKGMLDELGEAKIDVRIITGDNALTAVHVCRELEMPLKPKIAVVDVDAASGSTVYISADAVKTSTSAQWESFNSSNIDQVMAEYDLAMTGAALEKIRNDCGDDTIQRIIKQTPIFARVRPQQKTWIVEQLIEMGLVVGMCGDGTNDSGALKAAHVGLALSSAEASIVAPFTSKAKAILDVPVLLREGRCALTTSFQSFKFMCLYPIIQLSMVIVLAHVGSEADTEVLLTNNQYVWDDMAIVLGLSIAMLYTGPTYKLSPDKPPNTLFSLSIVASIVGQVAIFIAGFAAALAVLHHEDSWFCSVKDALAYVNDPNATMYPNCVVFKDYDMEALEYSYEDTTTWLFVHLSYIVVALAFNILKDAFRLPFYTNRIFTTLAILALGLNLWFLLDTSGVINDTFQVMPIPASFRWKLLLLFIAELFIASGWEYIATRTLSNWYSKKSNTL
ncbi:putative cation-transporting ATPase 13A4 [Phytophthora rubi]|uniref:Putative cation-transporting ATPase 13A4 n=1 Tax=Phytophthora rubi TaxID=129364 RepID=A0A6A3MZ55_9STRA|nr:putative cation-transporting ATPase 13A4 [Phytophthora rubi]